MAHPYVQGVGVAALTAISPGAMVNNSLFVSETMTPAQVEYMSTPIGIEGDWWFTFNNDTFEVWHKTPEQAYPHYTLQAGWNLAYESVGIGGGSTGTDYLNNNAANVGIKNYINAVTTQAVNEATSVYTQFISASIEGAVGGVSASVQVLEEAFVTSNSAFAAEITTIQANVATNAASIVTEASVRATADGHLSANYSITLTAGNVVTGMQLNSSSGGGTTVSSIIFTAANFQINTTGSTGASPFSVSGSTVFMSNATVSGIVDIGSGATETLINTSGIRFGTAAGQRLFMGTTGGIPASFTMFNTGNQQVGQLAQVTSTRQQLAFTGDPASGFARIQLDTNTGTPALVMTDGTYTTTYNPNVISFGPVASQQKLTASSGLITVSNAFNVGGLLTINSCNFVVATGTPSGPIADYFAVSLNGTAGYLAFYPF